MAATPNNQTQQPCPHCREPLRGQWGSEYCPECGWPDRDVPTWPHSLGVTDQ